MKKVFTILTIIFFSLMLYSCDKIEGEIEIDSIQARYLEMNDEIEKDINNERFSKIFEKSNPAALNSGTEYLVAIEMVSKILDTNNRSPVFSVTIEINDFESSGADDIKGVSASNGKVETYSIKNSASKDRKEISARFALPKTKNETVERTYYILLKMTPELDKNGKSYFGNIEVNLTNNKNLSLTGDLSIGKSFNIGVR